MGYLIRIFGLIMMSFSGFAQEQKTITDIHAKFSLHIDSIERRLFVSKEGKYEYAYLYYTIQNVSEDTLIYIKNSCFYYNHYGLKVGESEFNLNPEGGCLFNHMTLHTLAPGTSFSGYDWISAANLDKLEKGVWNARLSIPLVQHEENTFRVDGRSFVKDQLILTGANQALVTENITDTRKKKHKINNYTNISINVGFRRK